jgi:hypothetical protein
MLKLRITIDTFSGRENPVVELKGRAAKDAIERMQPERRLTKDDLGVPSIPTLGYRGMVVEQVEDAGKRLPKSFRLMNGDLTGKNLNHRAVDASFEEYMLRDGGPVAKLGLGAKFRNVLKREIRRFGAVRTDLSVNPTIVLPPIVNLCQCAPQYEPAWWNVPARQPFNNCYNYATNYRTNTFAQPGRAAGAMYSSLTCAAVAPAAVKDELINSPLANNKCPAEGHLVALVIWPGNDYHWYRKGRNGLWTHKPGGTAVTNLDNGGATIADPRTANRGPYTVFCTFMVVMHGHIRIS